ncbi:MAG: ATP-binding protein [Proteobacteria bacterium]|nr:ATP-binding protein [Pseudomonadota bacterium]
MKKTSSTAVDAHRLEAILTAVERMAGGDLTAQIPEAEKRDHLDAIAAAINILAAELRYTTVSKQYMVSVLDSLADLLIVVDDRGAISAVNEAARQTLGYSDDELVGRALSALVVQPEGERFEAELGRLAATKRRWRTKTEMRAKSGEQIPVALTASPLDRVRDEPGRVVCVARDLRDTHRLVAEREALEDQLQQAQKMEALGRLAGGISHDFNNVLTAIVNYADFLDDAMESDDPRRSDVAGIMTAAAGAERLIRQLMAFSRRQPLELQIVDVAELIGNLQGMLERILGEDVELVTRLHRDAGKVRIDPGQLEQVLVNLAVNARHAMVDGGSLVIAADTCELDRAEFHFMPEIDPGPYVRITVTDNGIGMTEEVKAHLFEPFFTTRAQGKGTGLGLATCYGIIKQARGRIEVDSAPGHGTEFRVYLPRTDAADATRRPSRETRRDDLHGHETILLVEDDAAVRELAERALSGLGYTVVTADNGVTALEELQRVSPDAIDLVVTDVVMPQMGGPELVSRVKVISPDMKILFMSGYTGDSELGEEIRTSQFFLPKPFASAALAKSVRAVLDHQEGPDIGS